MAEQLGKAQVEITADTKDLNRQIDAAQEKVGNFSTDAKKKIDSLAGPVRFLRRAFSRIIIPVIVADQLVGLAKRVTEAIVAVEELSAKFRELGVQGAAALSEIVKPDLGDLDKKLESITKKAGEEQQRVEDELNKERARMAQRSIYEKTKDAIVGVKTIEEREKEAENAKKAIRAAAEREAIQAREAAAKKAADDEAKRIKEIRDKLQAEQIAAADGFQKDQLLRLQALRDYQDATIKATSDTERQALKELYEFRLKAIDDAARKEIEAENEKQAKIREDAKKKSQEQAKDLQDALSAAYDRVAEKQREAFGLQDLKTNISRVGDLLAKLAQQYRGK